MSQIVLLGGSGFIATAAVPALAAEGHSIVVVDREPPRPSARRFVGRWIEADLTREAIELPEGRVILAIGGSDNHRLHHWTHLNESCVAVARLHEQIEGRKVVLLSSVDVYGAQAGVLGEETSPQLPLSETEISDWCTALLDRAASIEPEAHLPGLLARLSQSDPAHRWVYAVAKRAQEVMVGCIAGRNDAHILRMANVYGVGQYRVISQLAGQALAGRALTVVDTARSFVSIDRVVEAIRQAIGGRILAGVYNVADLCVPLPDLARLLLEELNPRGAVTIVPRPADDPPRIIDASRIQRFLAPALDPEHQLRRFVRESTALPTPIEPAVPVVVPPQPFDPLEVARRQHRCLQTGALKLGNQWTTRLTDLMASSLDLSCGQEILLTASGTAALRMAVIALAGPATRGDIAILPSFTFAATAEVLVQLGYKLRFCDVDPQTWTLAPQALEAALAKGEARVVVTVDALGNPCDYDALEAICAHFDVPLVADSAPSLGARYKGRPVGTQARAHAFSMSFAKVVSAGGAGGALVVPSDRVAALSAGANWWRSSQMTEMAAIVALDQVERLDRLVERRAAVAAAYAMIETLAPAVVPQRTQAASRHAWVHWAARFQEADRDGLAVELAAFGIGTKPYYAPALHTMPWGPCAEPLDLLPVTDLIAREVLALPMSSEIDAARAEQIGFTISRLRDKRSRGAVRLSA